MHLCLTGKESSFSLLSFPLHFKYLQFSLKETQIHSAQPRPCSNRPKTSFLRAVKTAKPFPSFPLLSKSFLLYEYTPLHLQEGPFKQSSLH